MQRRKVVKKGRRSLQWLRRRSLWKYKRGDYHQSVVLIANRAGISKWFHPFSLAKKESSFKKKYQFTLPKYQIHPQITNTHPIHTPKYQRDRCLDFQIVFFWLGFRGPSAKPRLDLREMTSPESWMSTNICQHQDIVEYCFFLYSWSKPVTNRGLWITLKCHFVWTITLFNQPWNPTSLKSIQNLSFVFV